MLSVALVAVIWSEAKQAREEVLRTVSANVANRLNEDMRKNSRSVAVLSTSGPLWKDGLSSPTVISMLSRVQAFNPDNTWIGVADMTGVVRAASGGILVGDNVSARPWFSPGTHGAYIGDVHPAKLLAARLPPLASGEPRRFVDFASPIRLDGQQLGVLVIHGSWDWVDTIVHTLEPNLAENQALETFIFDRTGAMVYARAGQLGRYVAAGQTLPMDAQASSPARLVRWRDGGAYLTAAYRVPPITDSIDMGWTVVTRQPAKIALAGAWTACVTAAILGTLTALVSLLVARRMAEGLARPLAQIATAARQVASGHATTIQRQGESLEVEALSGALNEMTDKLLAANAELEARVRERTEELSRVNESLAQLARLDPLTSLPNRRAFDEQGAQIITAARRSGQRVSVLIVDADHFKRVNDVHGHAAGDRTLVTIATALRYSVREQDVVARIGGEEFAVLLPGTDGAGALTVANKLVAGMRDVRIPMVGQITISCGAAEVTMPQGAIAEALDRADKALYRAKSAGRDRAEIAPMLTVLIDASASHPTA